LCRGHSSVTVPRFLFGASGRYRRETRWHTCGSATGQGQNRHFMAHFVLLSPARTLVADGDAPAGTLATAPPPQWVASLLYAFLAVHVETLSSPNPSSISLSFSWCGGGLIQIFLGFLQEKGARWRPATMEASSSTMSPTWSVPGAARLAASRRPPPRVSPHQVKATRSSHGGLLYPHNDPALPERP
jgi:hypothetical protein